MFDIAVPFPPFKMEFAIKIAIKMSYIYQTEVDLLEIYKDITHPKDHKHGQYQIPVFKYAKKLGVSPIELANRLCQ